MQDKAKHFKKVVFSVVALGNYIAIQWMLIDTESLPKLIIAVHQQSSQGKKNKKEKLRVKFAPKQTGSHLLATGSVLKANNAIITEKEKY